MINKIFMNPVNLKKVNSNFKVTRRGVFGFPSFLELGAKAARNLGKFIDLDFKAVQKIYNSFDIPSIASPAIREAYKTASKDIPHSFRESLKNASTTPFESTLAVAADGIVVFGGAYTVFAVVNGGISYESIFDPAINASASNSARECLFNVHKVNSPESEYFNLETVLAEENLMAKRYINSIKRLKTSYAYTLLCNTFGLSIGLERDCCLTNFLNSEKKLIAASHFFNEDVKIKILKELSMMEPQNSPAEIKTLKNIKSPLIDDNKFVPFTVKDDTVITQEKSAVLLIKET